MARQFMRHPVRIARQSHGHRILQTRNRARQRGIRYLAVTLMDGAVEGKLAWSLGHLAGVTELTRSRPSNHAEGHEDPRRSLASTLLRMPIARRTRADLRLAR
jgi:hypothetical protein